MNFENNVQQWISLDNQIKIYNEKIKELRDKKSILGTKISEHVFILLKDDNISIASFVFGFAISNLSIKRISPSFNFLERIV